MLKTKNAETRAAILTPPPSLKQNVLQNCSTPIFWATAHVIVKTTPLPQHNPKTTPKQPDTSWV